MSVLGLLGVAFVVLKLTGYIAWSWIWVTCPFWILFAVAVFLALTALVAALLGAPPKTRRRR